MNSPLRLLLKLLINLTDTTKRFLLLPGYLQLQKTIRLIAIENQKKRVENHLELDDSIPINLPTHNPSPEELLIATENMDHILEHIQSMKEEYRNLIRMRYFDNLSLREIEVLLQEPATTIRVKLFRAKKMLANLLHKDEI